MRDAFERLADGSVEGNEMNIRCVYGRNRYFINHLFRLVCRHILIFHIKKVILLSKKAAREMILKFCFAGIVLFIFNGFHFEREKMEKIPYDRNL